MPDVGIRLNDDREERDVYAYDRVLLLQNELSADRAVRYEDAMERREGRERKCR